MKILLVHNNFVPIGGAEVFFHETNRILKKNHIKTALFSTYEEGQDIDSEWKNYFIKIKNHKKNLAYSLFNASEIIYSNRSKNKFQKLIDDFQPDIVHIFAIYLRITPSILDICREKKIPVIMSCNDYKHLTPEYKLYPFKKNPFDFNNNSIVSLSAKIGNYIDFYFHKIFRTYERGISLYLFASNFMANETKKRWKNKKYKWDILKNPYNSKKNIPNFSNENYCLYFGRLSDEKGVDILIKAAKISNHCKLKIVGDGPYREHLEKLSSKYENKIEFLGEVWGSELESLVKNSKFVVCPSIWHENFPYVIIQSQSFGKAVIGSNVGGIPEMVDHKISGFIYQYDNYRMLSSYIDKLWNDTSLVVKMGKNAKEKADREFNDEIFFEKLMQIYNKFKK
tara:strand:+ start:15486 stop:16673 length:1188 start_codon:yes stop_codon:yes gene_type:complete